MGTEEQQKIGALLRQLRLAKGLLLRELSAKTQLDTTLLSKIEHGDRLPTREQIRLLVKVYREAKEKIMLSWLSDRIVQEVGQEKLAIAAISVAESKIKYGRGR